MLIRTEQTPNPATRKFLPGQPVMDAGSRDFPDRGTAEASPLASELFATGTVEGVARESLERTLTGLRRYLTTK